MSESKLYNPASQSKDWLIEHFVVRTKVFEKIFKDIKEGDMKYPEQHYLIQGQRGMGKTTLLLRLKYEVENTPKLNKWLIPVFFNEESYDLTSLSNLWEKLLKYLDDLWETDGEYYNKTESFMETADYEKKCFNFLLEILNTKKKKLIILFDNFGQLFLDNLKEREQHRLREILMSCAEIRIIGASAVVMNDLHDYSKPFFEFFKIVKLEGLNKDETVELIRKLQEKSGTDIDIKKSKAKIETLAILTGGVIRTIMLIYEVVLTDKDGTALRDLETILDRTTPLYKHRIEDLPVQQRKIIDVIAKKWDAITTKEIAESIRENGKKMESKTISAQLSQMEANGVIEKKQTTTKNHLYQLNDRFFNIWYLMRNGDRKDKCRVIWLTKFLELWYSNRIELESFIKDHIEHLRSGSYNPNSAIMISEALFNSNKIDIASLKKLLQETASILSDEQRKSLPSISTKAEVKAAKFFMEKKFDDSIRLLTSIKEKNITNSILLAMSLRNANRINEALEVLDTLQPLEDENRFVIATQYFSAKQYEKCITLLKKYSGENKSQVFYFLGKSSEFLGRFDEAIAYFIQAVELNNPDAYGSLIAALMQNGRYDEAEKYCIMAISKGLKQFYKQLIALYILPLQTNNNLKKAKKLIQENVANDSSDPDLYYLTGLVYYFKNEIDKAEEYLSKANSIYSVSNIDSINFSTSYSLLLNIYIDVRKDLKGAERVLQHLSMKVRNEVISLYEVFVAIWSGKYEIGIELLMNYLKDDSRNKIPVEFQLLNQIIALLMSKRQYHTALKVFNASDFKDRFKPTYYALMYLLQDEYPNEHLKMGEELKQPVEDVLKRIEEMATEYA